MAEIYVNIYLATTTQTTSRFPKKQPLICLLIQTLKNIYIYIIFAQLIQYTFLM